MSEQSSHSDCEDHISYIDENGDVKNYWVDITELNVGYVTFLTPGSTEITIPLSRVLKIKRKREEQTDGGERNELRRN